MSWKIEKSKCKKSISYLYVLTEMTILVMVCRCECRWALHWVCTFNIWVGIDRSWSLSANRLSTSGANNAGFAWDFQNCWAKNESAKDQTGKGNHFAISPRAAGRAAPKGEEFFPLDKPEPFLARGRGVGISSSSRGILGIMFLTGRILKLCCALPKFKSSYTHRGFSHAITARGPPCTRFEKKEL